MFERPKSGERALVLQVSFGGEVNWYERREFADLSASAGAEIQIEAWATRRAPEPKYLFGLGKAEEVNQYVKDLKIQLVLVSHPLTPSQERNLEKLFECRVLDRTGLILDIFAQRAQSHEGKLQVELAQLRHLSTRLVRGWTHLERQKGGIGLRGPGETQLETDRRLLGQRIKVLNARLERISAQRSQRRLSRNKHDVTTVSLVGYTNAGKSSLFNRLTNAEVYAQDQLFATLDPTLRQVELARGRALVLADTVGFVRDLPHDLVNAFHATLEESRDAHLLLHVVDASSPELDVMIDQVNHVLAHIGAEDVPQIIVYNKIDQTDMEPGIEWGSNGLPRAVRVSAHSGAGMDLLSQALSEFQLQDAVEGWLTLPVQLGALRAELFSIGAVQEEQIADDGGYWLKVELSDRDYQQRCRVGGELLVLHPQCGLMT